MLKVRISLKNNYYQDLIKVIFANFILFCISGNVVASSITISTYNILSAALDHNCKPDRPCQDWSVRKNDVFQVINSANPDILALQEDVKSENQALDLIIELDGTYDKVIELPQEDRYPNYCPYRPDEENERLSIWIKEGKFIVLDEDSEFWQDDTCQAGFTWAKLQYIETSKVFYIYNLHPNAAIDHPNLPPGNQFYEKKRRLLMKELADHMWNNGSAEDYRILTGDFNAKNRNNGDDISLLYWINEEDYYPSTIMSYPDNFQKLFCADPEDNCINNKVDHVLISKGLKKVDAYWSGNTPNANGDYPSDHDMLTVEIIPDYSWLVPLMEYHLESGQ